MEDSFKLSATLKGHASDVRAVLLPKSSFAVTASRDGTTRIWKQTSTTPPTYDGSESSNGANFKTCLAFATPTKPYPEGLIISSGQDGLIEARQPSTTADGNADGFMVGHSNQVCSLDVNTEAGWIVSGSWDSKAIIWYIDKWEPEVVLDGHTGSVWAVVAYDKETIITGCADQAIRAYTIHGKMLVSFHGKDIVRALAKLPERHPSGGDIASASNDGVIRIWTLKGMQLAELHGHESFIYSLSVLPTGELVSSGEDRSVRIWSKNACVQVITLPAISVWSVSASSNGDIIVGSSDKIARIFTRDQTRIADAQAIADFDESVSSSAVPQQQLGQINKTDLPGPDFLQSKSGTKEGQSQMIKELDGSTVLYQWSVSQQTWVKIGEVVESAAGSKKTFNGKEYDYVFDIDIEDGKPPLKLPYNVTQNPYEAATKFLSDNELPMTYLEETANFIIKNAQGASLGETEPQSNGLDPWGQESRYRPGSLPTSSYQPPPKATSKRLPQKEYLSITMGKPKTTWRHILKLNDEYHSKNDNNSALSTKEIDEVTQLVEQLDTYEFQQKPSLTSSPAFEATLSVALRIGTTWQPPANRLAGLDLLRFLAAASAKFPDFEVDGNDAIELIVASGIFNDDLLHSHPKLAMVAIRFFSNLIYGSDFGRALVHAHLPTVLPSLKAVTPMATTDQTIAVALATFYLNLAIFITSDDLAQPEEGPDLGLTIVQELATILSSLPTVDHKLAAGPLGQSTEPAFRGLMALGTVLVGLNDKQVSGAAEEIFEVPKLLRQLKTRRFLDEPRFRGVVDEINAALEKD